MTHKTTQPAVPTPEKRAGLEIKRLRKERRWSQDEVARQMVARGFSGFHQTTVGRTETAQRPLRLNEAVAFAEIFRVPVAQLLWPAPVNKADLDEEIERTEAEVKMFEQRVSDTSSTVEQLKKAEVIHDRVARELERATSHLEILREMRRQMATPETAQRLGKDES